jgi:putative flippase GtrA
MFTGKRLVSGNSNFSGLIRNYLPKRFILFLFVGLINTGFGYGLFALLIYLKVHYALASLLSTFIGILFNFKTTGVIVFRNNRNILIFRFFLVYGITYLLGLLFLYITNRFAISNYIAGAVWLLPGAIISYFLQKSLVFRFRESK